MKRERVTAWVYLGTLVAVARPLHAETSAGPTESAEARSAAAAATSRGAGVDDVLYLKDGSMLRGAIIERIPSESVTLLLPSGQVRRFKLDEVTYAGAVSSAPGAASVTPVVTPPAASGAITTPSAAAGTTPLPAGSVVPSAAPAVPTRPNPAALAVALPPPTAVHFKAAEPLAFSVFTGTSEGLIPGFRWGSRLSIDNYRLLCSAPCTEELKKGRYRFSLTHDGHTVSAEAEVAVSPGDTVTGHYESFAETRWIGFGVWVVGTAVGVTYGIAGLADHSDTCDVHSSYSDFSACVSRNQSNNDAQHHFLISGGIELASLLVGGLLMLKQDEVTVQVTAGVAPAPAATEGNGASDRRGLGLFQPRGLTLSARF